MAEVVERTGVPLDTVIDYTPLPLLWEHGGLSFVALQTGKALRAEGAAMHHCVASYWQNVVEGRSRIYSILENGSRVATLELTSRPTQHKGPKRIGQHSRYQVSQLGGARNSRPAPEVVKVVGTFVEEINNRARTVGAIDLSTRRRRIAAVVLKHCPVCIGGFCCRSRPLRARNRSPYRCQK